MTVTLTSEHRDDLDDVVVIDDAPIVTDVRTEHGVLTLSLQMAGGHAMDLEGPHYINITQPELQALVDDARRNGVAIR